MYFYQLRITSLELIIDNVVYCLKNYKNKLTSEF